MLRWGIAALRGTRSLAYLFDRPRPLRSVRLALYPARGFLRRFLNESSIARLDQANASTFRSILALLSSAWINCNWPLEGTW